MQWKCRAPYLKSRKKKYCKVYHNIKSFPFFHSLFLDPSWRFCLLFNAVLPHEGTRVTGGPALQPDTLTARVLSPNHRLTFGDQLGHEAAGGGEQAAKTPPGEGSGNGETEAPSLQHTHHCSIRLHLQNTNSKIKSFRILGQQPEHETPSMGLFRVTALTTHPRSQPWPGLCP